MLLHFKVHHTHAEQPGGCSPTWHFLAIYVHHSQTMAVNLGRARPTGTNHTIQNSFHPFEPCCFAACQVNLYQRDDLVRWTWLINLSSPPTENHHFGLPYPNQHYNHFNHFPSHIFIQIYFLNFPASFWIKQSFTLDKKWTFIENLQKY